MSADRGEDSAVAVVAGQKQVEIGVTVPRAEVGVAVAPNYRMAQPDVVEIGTEAEAQYITAAAVYSYGVGGVQTQEGVSVEVASNAGQITGQCLGVDQVQGEHVGIHRQLGRHADQIRGVFHDGFLSGRGCLMSSL